MTETILNWVNVCVKKMMKSYCSIASMITLKGGYNLAGRWSFQNLFLRLQGAN